MLNLYHIFYHIVYCIVHNWCVMLPNVHCNYGSFIILLLYVINGNKSLFDLIMKDGLQIQTKRLLLFVIRVHKLALKCTISICRMTYFWTVDSHKKTLINERKKTRVWILPEACKWMSVIDYLNLGQMEPYYLLLGKRLWVEYLMMK